MDDEDTNGDGVGTDGVDNPFPILLLLTLLLLPFVVVLFVIDGNGGGGIIICGIPLG